jgi:HEAT repeat protein
MPPNSNTAQLIHDLRHAPSAVTRYNAAVRLGLAGAASAAQALADVMQQDDDEDWGVRQNAVWAAGQARLTACIPALATRLSPAEQDEQVRYVAALALVRIGTPAAWEHVRAQLNSTDDNLRRAAAAALRAAPYLTE